MPSSPSARKPMPEKIYTASSNFQYRWSTEETVKFLNLLQRHPVLYKKNVNTKQTIARRKAAFQSLLRECSKAQLGIRDREALRSKINILRASFVASLQIYKSRVKRSPNRLPEATLQWFHEAHFLDNTGYLRKLAAKWGSLKKGTVLQQVAKASPSASAVRSITHHPGAVPPPNKKSNRTTRSSSSTAMQTPSDANVSSNCREIKIEQDQDYEGEEDDEDFEEGEVKADEEEGDDAEYEQGEFVTEQQPRQQQHQKETRNQQPRPQANLFAGGSAGGGGSSIGQQHPARNQEMPLTVHVAPRPNDYFHAFLQYTKLRTEDYSARHKREIINALTSAMNRIDEENEEAQDYSIQMYSSLNEFNDAEKD